MTIFRAPIVCCSILLLVCLSSSARTWDLTGTWKFSVDLENGQHGDPVIVLKQVNETLTGSYQGPFGKQKVAGNINGETVTLEVDAAAGGRTLKLSYTGRIESAERMSGTMTRNISGQSTPGKWTAVRSK